MPPDLPAVRCEGLGQDIVGIEFHHAEAALGDRQEVNSFGIEVAKRAILSDIEDEAPVIKFGDQHPDVDIFAAKFQAG